MRAGDWGRSAIKPEIFGLVFGVAATTAETKTVLIAGASGASAAAVSMMAGTYLDVETARVEARAAASLETDIRTAPATELERVAGRLRDEGLSPEREGALATFLGSDPRILKCLASALETPADCDRQGPLARSLWMLGLQLRPGSGRLTPR